MRFSELRLLKYGHFQDCSLSFPSGGSDLQLILGPNEAGKSTALAAVSDLLFGFKPRTRFAFRFNQNLLRIGAVLEADGSAIEVCRRKGTGETLTGGDEKPLSETVLTAMLGGQTRDSFRRMFGLDHAQLRAGGEQIIKAEDDVGAAIFAAGSGIVQVAKVCDELEAEAKAIWAKGAGENRRYTAALGAFQQAKADLRAAEVRPTTWLKARKELDAAEAELQLLSGRRAALSKAQRELQRKLRILGPSVRRAAALARLHQLGRVLRLSGEEANACETALIDRHTAEIDLSNALGEIARLAEQLDAAQPDGNTLTLSVEVDALRELKGVVDTGSTDVPVLLARREHAWSRAVSMAGELGWTALDVASLQSRLPSRTALALVQDLLEKRVGIDEQARGAQHSLRDAESTEKTLKAKLSDLPSLVDTRTVQSLLRDIRSAGLTQALAHAAKTHADLDRVLASQLRVLAPWTGEIEALRALPFPALDDVEAIFNKLDRALERVELEEENERRETEHLEELQLQLRHASLTHPAPTQEALDVSRATRQSLWAPLKDHLLGRSSVGDVPGSVAGLEQAILASDRVADERFASAEHAGALAALDREIEKAELTIRQVQKRLCDARGDAAAAQNAFTELVAPLGVALSPEAYPAWRDACLSAIGAADAVQRAVEEHESAREAEQGAAQSLALAISRDQPSQPAGLPLTRLIAEAEQLIEESNEARIREERLRAELRSAEEVLARGHAQFQSATDAELRWVAEWHPALLAAGLTAAASVATARAQLEVIDNLRGELETLSELDDRLQVIRHTADAFDARVQSAADQAGLGGLKGPQGFQELQQKVATEQAKALQAATRREALETANAAAELAQSKLQRAAGALSDLDSLQAGEGGISHRELLERSREASRLRSQIQDVEEEILTAGDGQAIEALVALVAGGDTEELQASVEELEGQLDKVTREIEAMREVRLSAELAFAAVDDRPDAAIAAAKIAAARSEMAYQAELYLHKRAEVRLLRTAIERYRQEKQGPLLTRASSLFETLTLGRFSRLIVDYDADKPTLAGVRSDDTVVPVDGMSEGTIDQLYLALRVAAVEDAVRGGVRLPFLADDLFINFDDERAAAGFKVLAELARSTQVLFFTHHEHLAEVANRALAPAKISVCGLKRLDIALLVAE